MEQAAAAASATAVMLGVVGVVVAVVLCCDSTEVTDGVFLDELDIRVEGGVVAVCCSSLRSDVRWSRDAKGDVFPVMQMATGTLPHCAQRSDEVAAEEATAAAASSWLCSRGEGEPPGGVPTVKSSLDALLVAAAVCSNMAIFFWSSFLEGISRQQYTVQYSTVSSFFFSPRVLFPAFGTYRPFPAKVLQQETFSGGPKGGPASQR